MKDTIEKNYIPALHAFRAFAIINIVALHAIEIIFYFSSLAENKADITFFSWSAGILFHDSTLYFTFISGILFSLVLAKRGYAQFFKSKLLNVLLPYLLITCFMTWRIAKTDAPIYFDGSLWEFINVWSNKFITGSAVFSFWYMPVLFVLYLATPLLAKLLTLKNARWLVIVIILMPLIFSRSWPGLPWVNFVYFIGAYMLGMLVGENYQKTIEFIRHYLLSFVLTAIFSTGLLFVLFYFEKPGIWLIDFSETVWYVQKIVITGLVITFFEKTIRTVPKWLDVLANYTFTIYFLHVYVMFEMYIVMDKLIASPSSVPIILLLALFNVVAVITVCVILTYVFKLLFRKYSRLIVGA